MRSPGSPMWRNTTVFPCSMVQREMQKYGVPGGYPKRTLNDQITINLGAQIPQHWVSMFSDVTTLGTAQGAITAIDTALDTLATDRAELGSKINEMTAAVDNLATTVENLSTANSQIRDADISRESAAFTKNNVLMRSVVYRCSHRRTLYRRWLLSFLDLKIDPGSAGSPSRITGCMGLGPH